MSLPHFFIGIVVPTKAPHCDCEGLLVVVTDCTADSAVTAAPTANIPILLILLFFLFVFCFLLTCQLLSFLISSKLNSVLQGAYRRYVRARVP